MRQCGNQNRLSLNMKEIAALWELLVSFEGKSP
jgi:hypothetical protein